MTMTLDEAIQHCEEVAYQKDLESGFETDNERYAMTDKERADCKECAEEHRQLAEWLKELKAYRNKSEISTSCGDAISRQAVLDLVADYDLSMGQVVKGIHALPSVTPQQRIGRWIQKEEEGEAEPFIIWECSECHCVDEDGKPSYKYCPQCGAKMEVEE